VIKHLTNAEQNLSLQEITGYKELKINVTSISSISSVVEMRKKFTNVAVEPAAKSS